MTTTTERHVDPETGEILDDPMTPATISTWAHSVNGTDDTRWHLLPPDDNDFDESESGFILSDPLAELGAELIERHHRRFYYISAMDLTIVYCWKRTGGSSNGKRTFGKCQKTSGALNLFSESAWIIWLAADHVRDAGWGADQIERLLFHELNHTGFDAKKGPIVKPHDFAGFNDEVTQYGLWHPDLANAGRTMRDSGAIDDLPDHESVMRNPVVRG